MIAYNIGQLYDLISVYQTHFGFSQKNEKNELYFAKIENGDILDEFMPFFYPLNGKVFIENILFNDIDRFKNDELTSIFESFLDYRSLTNHLLRFYFKYSEISFVDGDYSSLQSIGKIVSKSELPNDLKNNLLSFLFEPVVLTQKFVANMIYIAKQIPKLYENSMKRITDLMNFVDSDKLSEIVRRYADGPFDLDKPTYYSIGVLRPDDITVRCMADCQLAYLGMNYEENINKKEEFRIDLFGNVISEQNRLTILDYILKKGSATTSEINHIFGYSGTTSYYHLAMMLKIGMIKSELKGKTLHYSINKEFFAKVVAYMKKFEE